MVVCPCWALCRQAQLISTMQTDLGGGKCPLAGVEDNWVLLVDLRTMISAMANSQSGWRIVRSGVTVLPTMKAMQIRRTIRHS